MSHIAVCAFSAQSYTGSLADVSQSSALAKPVFNLLSVQYVAVQFN